MFKIAAAFFVVLGLIVWGQHYAGSWITQHVAELPAQQPFPTTPSVSGIGTGQFTAPQFAPLGHIPATRP